jgi:hypothetical protein
VAADKVKVEGVLDQPGKLEFAFCSKSGFWRRFSEAQTVLEKIKRKTRGAKNSSTSGLINYHYEDLIETRKDSSI